MRQGSDGLPNVLTDASALLRLDPHLDRQPTEKPLWFCDYVNYYLKVRKSAAEVGAASHASYEASIRDLIYNNNIACSMAPPN